MPSSRVPGLLLLFTGLLSLFVTARPARADTIIKLDSEFQDWQGQMYIGDRTGDSHSHNGDLIGFYWANNPDDETCYWMIERVAAKGNVSYIVYLDANNNGHFSDHDDRAIVVEYRPKKKDSKVSVEVRRADNWRLIDRSNNNDWGESLDEGAARVEFGVSFKVLGIGIGQTIRMYAASFASQSGGSQSFGEEGAVEEESEAVADLQDHQHLPWPDDRIPDSGDVQWSPVSILGYSILGVVMVGGIVSLWYFKGRHTWRSK